MSELERLRDRVADLDEALGLTATLPDALMPRSLLTRRGRPKTLQIISLLLSREFASRDAIYLVFYGARPECDQPNSRIVDVYLCSARASLRAHGVEMKTIWGKGWYLDAPNKAKLRAVIIKLNNGRAIEAVPHPAPTVTLNTEILTLTDRYAAAEGVSRDTATNQIMREWLEAYFRRAA